ncbi:hypothetical protein SUGI_0746850 [Cryptomeria japonica]|uniref:phosphatidylinositol N-acetylglucosaminyltransferase subunit P n=1 Tax=Cryptomeria japonica TaxID=3369 RepID=UPI002414A8C6|nr:phosphatidylinositol N-acetylglucosaminyltransferase subunit P [Cryptomeria japonica]XP_057864533.1 phosphatidylinositol N-acetylglucosaminyltransferase subunit P [Cryptomeria japonica]GLJ36934.1 hypothetical protein SUGI_0746850 [Cryptomeria japonica]
MVDSSVSSPRRMLSLSRERAFVSILDDDKDGKAVLSSKQGANTSEVYGFVGSISTIVVIGLFFLWAYLPEPWLHYLGITYYPSRYWALALPTYALVTIIFIMSFYLSLNCMATVPATSWSSLFDEYTREASRSLSGHASTNEEDPIDPISDIRITEINARVFGIQK